MLSAISILSVFCRDTSALRSSCYSYLSDKFNYKLPFSPSTRCSSLISRESCWQSSLGQTDCGCWFFCHLAHCREVIGFRLLFSSLTVCVTTYHNHFSLPISLQPQLPFKSHNISRNFYHHWTLFKFYVSTVSSLQILDAKSVFHPHFQVALFSFACMSRNQGIVETGRDL